MLSRPINTETFKVGECYGCTHQKLKCCVGLRIFQTCDQANASFQVKGLHNTLDAKGKIRDIIADTTYRLDTAVSKLCRRWYAHLTGNKAHADPDIDTHMKRMESSTWSYTQTTWI